MDNNNNNKESFYRWAVVARLYAVLVPFCFGMSCNLYAQVSSSLQSDPDSSQNQCTALVSERSVWEGKGTATEPYKVTTLTQLQAMCSRPRAHYVLTNNIDAGQTREWNDGDGFIPIGPFFGSFNGDRYAIRNLFINLPEGRNVGMFSSLEEGSYLRLVTLVDSQTTGRSYVGTLAGHNKGIIENSTVRGGVLSGSFQAGSMVGQNDGVISDSHARTETRAHIKLYSYEIGGFVGYNTGTIRNSGSSGRVDGGTQAGGLAGKNEGHILDCYASGQVYSTSRAIGGLVGRNSEGGTITHSYAAGTVAGNGATGGLTGFNLGTISYSYATGSVSGTGDPTSGIGEPNSRMGGHTGNNYGVITHSYATGSVSGNSNLGGFAGSNSRHISNSYASGKVSGQKWIGGFVGTNYIAATVTYSYFASSSIRGTSWVGGFAGYNLGGIHNSYTAGKVAGDTKVNDFSGTNIGDINIGDIRGSFPRTLTQLKCPTESGKTCAGATTYSDWDADSWHFGSGRTLPLHSHTKLTKIPAAPTGLAANFASSTNLILVWQSSELSADFHELEISGLTRNVTSAYSTVPNEHLDWLRNEYGHGSMVSYSVRTHIGGIAGHPSNGYFRLPTPPEIPGIQIQAGVTEADITVSVSDDVNSKAKYLIRIFQEENPASISTRSLVLGDEIQTAEIKFSDLISNAYYKIILSDKEGDTLTEKSFVTGLSSNSKPRILAERKTELPVTSGEDSELRLVLSASAHTADSLTWQVSPNHTPQKGWVCFLLKEYKDICAASGVGTQVTVVYLPEGDIQENDGFSVEAIGNNGFSTITVLVKPSNLPTISGNKEQYLEIPAHQHQVSLQLYANTHYPEELDSLEWTAKRVAGTPEESMLNFLVNNQVATAKGPVAKVQFTRPEGSRSTGQFIVSAKDRLGGTTSIRLIVRQANSTPVISQISGSSVLDADSINIHLAPGLQTVLIHLVAQGGVGQNLKWELVNTYDDRMMVEFVGEDSKSSVLASQSRSEMRVRCQILQGSPFNGNSFLVKASDADDPDKTDQVLVRMLSNVESPVLVQGQLLERTIPFSSQELTVSLNTTHTRAGLTWSLVNSSPTETSAKFAENHGSGLTKLKLTIPEAHSEATFNIRVAAGGQSHDLKLKVTRILTARLRLKLFLGGLVR